MIPDLPKPVELAVPAFVLLIVIEMIWAKYRAPEKYEPRDTLTSLAFGFGSTVVGALVGGLVIAMSFAVYEFRVATIPFAWWAWIVCFVLDDLAYRFMAKAYAEYRYFTGELFYKIYANA